jgi:hypothetical protein
LAATAIDRDAVVLHDDCDFELIGEMNQYEVATATPEDRADRRIRSTAAWNPTQGREVRQRCSRESDTLASGQPLAAEFAENGPASLAEPLQSPRDLGTPKWTPDRRGETSVSAYKERHATNSSWYSNRGICRIYCDAHGRHDVARVGAAAA